MYGALNICEIVDIFIYEDMLHNFYVVLWIYLLRYTIFMVQIVVCFTSSSYFSSLRSLSGAHGFKCDGWWTKWKKQ